MLGILVHGDNHFIVEGPLPDHATARRLVWQWEVPQLVGGAPAEANWRIITRAFREDLRWAVVLRGTAGPQLAVAQLLAEVAARGVEIHYGAGPWFDKADETGWAADDSSGA